MAWSLVLITFYALIIFIEFIYEQRRTNFIILEMKNVEIASWAHFLKQRTKVLNEIIIIFFSFLLWDLYIYSYKKSNLCVLHDEWTEDGLIPGRENCIAAAPLRNPLEIDNYTLDFCLDTAVIPWWLCCNL